MYNHWMQQFMQVLEYFHFRLCYTFTAVYVKERIYFTLLYCINLTFVVIEHILLQWNYSGSLLVILLNKMCLNALLNLKCVAVIFLINQCKLISL